VWNVQLIVPVHKMDAISVYKAAFQEQLASPMRPTILGDLQWYFHARPAASRRRIPSARSGGRRSVRLDFRRSIVGDSKMESGC
jgi:hypothetical protein